MILSTGGGGSARGGCLVPRGAWWRPPPGRLLLRTVRILLECILVWPNVFRKLHENERNWTESLVDPRGWRQGHALPVRGLNSFIFMQCSAKKLQNNRLAHPLWELAPLQENIFWVRHSSGEAMMCHSNRQD